MNNLSRTGKKVAALIVAITIIVIGVLIRWTYMPRWPSSYNPQESLEHLPAPEDPPSLSVNETNVGDITLSSKASFSTMEPHLSPNTFSFTLHLNVTNNGTSIINDLHVERLTIFYEDSTPVYTFGLLPSENVTISAESSRILEYQKDRDMMEVPSRLLTESQAFASVRVTFSNDIEVILTTPLAYIGHAIE